MRVSDSPDGITDGKAVFISPVAAGEGTSSAAQTSKVVAASGLTVASVITSGNTITFQAGSDYVYTLSDATAGPGQTQLYVYADQLGPGDNLTFDGSAETTASIYLTAGAGVDVLKGGQVNDHFVMHDHLTAADSVDGGTGYDWLYLIGDYSTGLVFAAATIKNIESLYFGAGSSYKLTLNDANIAADQQLQIYGGDLLLTDSLNVNGTAETNGSFYFNSTTTRNTLSGGAQADTFYIHNGVGHGGVGTLNGGAGDDIFVFDGDLIASNSINGGDGTDSIDLSGFGSTLTLIMTATTMKGIESLSLSGGSASITTNDANIAAGTRLAISSDTGLTLNGSAEKDGYFLVSGSEYADSIRGGSLHDVINTYGGNDVINGGAGADAMNGGFGDDTYIVDNADDVVIEASAGGNDTIYASLSYSLSGKYVENLFLTGSDNLNVTGNAGDNLLVGNAGNNVFNGGAGADTMNGEGGNDLYYVDNAGDTIIEGNGGGTDSVYAGISYSLTGSYLENLFLTGTANINATGNAGDNLLVGNSGNNVFNGGGGADTMNGEAGNDTYYVDNAGDTVIEGNGGGIDSVISAISYSLTGSYLENLTLTGTGNTNATGNNLANILTGNAGSNTFNGGAGNDILTGAGGNDTFWFGAGSGADTITDFSNDTINLNAYSHGVTNGGGIVISQVGGNTTIDLGGGNIITLTGIAPTDLTGHIVW